MSEASLHQAKAYTKPPHALRPELRQLCCVGFPVSISFGMKTCEMKASNHSGKT